MILTEEEVYKAFRSARGIPFRMPKDWQKKWESFKPEERENIRKMVRYLATTWQDINIDTYFRCGYELWKGFYINKWFAPQIINLYIQKSKNKKRIEENVKRTLKNSFDFVLEFCKEKNIKSLNVYSRIRDDQKLIIMEHFVKDYVSKWFLVYMIQRRYCIMNQNDWDKVPFDMEKVREMKMELREYFQFTKKLEEEFNEKLKSES